MTDRTNHLGLIARQYMTDEIAFGADLHRERAAQIFAVLKSDVTPEQRRFAKLINYADMYVTSHRWPESPWVVIDSMSQLIEDRAPPVVTPKTVEFPPPGSKLLHRLLGRAK